MSVQPGLTTTGFWDQQAQLRAPQPDPTIEYGLSGSAPGVKYGRLRGGACIECTDALCGGVSSSTGDPLAWRPCSNNPPPCYYDSMQLCQHGKEARTTMTSAMSSMPFGHVMVTSFSQPNYAEAFQTFSTGL